MRSANQYMTTNNQLLLIRISLAIFCCKQMCFINTCSYSSQKKKKKSVYLQCGSQATYSIPKKSTKVVLLDNCLSTPSKKQLHTQTKFTINCETALVDLWPFNHADIYVWHFMNQQAHLHHRCCGDSLLFIKENANLRP